LVVNYTLSLCKQKPQTMKKNTPKKISFFFTTEKTAYGIEGYTCTIKHKDTHFTSGWDTKQNWRSRFQLTDEEFNARVKKFND
jgi:hypothetical protein